MALQIVQGPLLNDGETGDPTVFLEAWIAGTEVFNLPGTAFSGGTLQFVWSQTDEPQSYEVFPGLLWFKRGEGRLFVWDIPDMPSLLTFADAGWIALSDRREIWARAQTNVALGAPCKFTDTNSSLAETDILTTTLQAGNNDVPYRPIWGVQCWSDTSAHTNLIPEIILVAMETASSGSLFRLCEMGMCNVLAGSGESGNWGSMVIDDRVPGWFKRIDPTCGSQCPYMPIAETMDSSASNPGDYWLRPAFKHMMPMQGGAATV